MNLVTGGTGHIGNVLVKELLRRKDKVRVLVLPGEDLSPLKDMDVEIAYGNVLDFASLMQAMQGVETVFHLAGIISIMPGQDHTVHDVNVFGTKNVVQAAHLAGVKKMVYTSSIHAFKRMPFGITIDENIPIDPQTAMGAYDRSKAEATLAVLAESKIGFPAVIVCPTGVIGPFDYKDSELGELIQDWIDHKVNFLIDGCFDFVDVRDVVQGMIQARDRGRSGQIYILSGELLKVHDLWDLVKELVEYRSTAINIPLRLAKFVAWFTQSYYRMAHKKPRFTSYSIDTLQSNAVINNSKARTELGYSPRSLRETITDTVKWWRDQRKGIKQPQI